MTAGPTTYPSPTVGRAPAAVHRRRRPVVVVVVALVSMVSLILAGCSASTAGPSAPPRHSRTAARPHTAPPATAPVPSAAHTSRASTPDPSTPDPSTPAPTTSAPPRAASTPATQSASPTIARSTSSGRGAVPPSGTAPVIVLDPGHSPSIHAIDPRTGLDVSDYENEPEMRDVFAVAELVRVRLEAAGYRVVMTKTHVRQRVSLGQRAAIANRVHADLALSIHDQAGSDGGIGFRQGNNIVYYQSVGTYRATPAGKRVYFTDRAVAAVSHRYGRIFQSQRHSTEQVPITLQGDVGYNLGSRGLAPGNIWLVQLLSKVPWIYNESGGNSAGRSGLDGHDKLVYAESLVAGVEHCIPPPH